MFRAMSRRAQDTSFLLITSGSSESVPASAFRDWLLERGARVSMVVHPLAASDRGYHRILRYTDGQLSSERRIRLPSTPPLTYPLDLLAPPLLPRGDVVIAFNNLHAARALLSRPRRTVIYCAVDFVPHRFGAGTLLTRVFEEVDRWVCGRVAARFELSQTGLDGRNETLGLVGKAARAEVVPVGAWLDRLPQVPEDGDTARRVIFMGHLVERMGVGTLLDALALLRDRGVTVTADIIGHGPIGDALQLRSRRLGLSELLHWHGFVEDHRELEALLAQASIAVAPYSTQVESFTRFADPGKIKSYLAAGLPILMTDVPPNAEDVAANGGAQIVEDSPEAFAAAIETLLSDADLWRRRRSLALSYVRRFDWNLIVPEALTVIDIV
jgi:glycosyltransferase involved in cell wall biosynthesis